MNTPPSEDSLTASAAEAIVVAASATASVALSATARIVTQKEKTKRAVIKASRKK